MSLLQCSSFFFFFNDTATTEIYTLSLHDALPISGGLMECIAQSADKSVFTHWYDGSDALKSGEKAVVGDFNGDGADDILAYNPTTGSSRIVTFISGALKSLPNYSTGNLSGLSLVNK